jgi:hypothetical protein
MSIADVFLVVFYLGGVVLLSLKYKKINNFQRLFIFIGLMHLLMSFAYFQFSKNNPADAVGYYMQARDAILPWFSYFGQDIQFMVFLTYPLVQWFGLSYFGATLVYSFVGLLGFVMIIEVLRSVSQNKWNNWYYLLLLPNLHFWTVGVGKDSIVFFAMSFLLYNIYFKKTWYFYLLPMFLIGYIRIHILVFSLGAFGVTQLFINRKLKISTKIILISALFVVVILLMPMFADRLNISEEKSFEDTIEQFDSMEAMGGSGVDMRGKNIVVKWISFMFRPLFVDAHSFLTLIASVENIFWIIMVFLIVKNRNHFLSVRLKTHFWFSIFMIIAVTIPSAFGLYNLGIAMRQKYMIFPFLILAFFIAIHGVDRKKNLMKNLIKQNKLRLKKTGE